MPLSQRQRKWRERYSKEVDKMTNRYTYINKHSETTTRKITPEEIEKYNVILNKTDCHKLIIREG